MLCSGNKLRYICTMQFPQLHDALLLQSKEKNEGKLTPVIITPMQVS